MTELEKYISNYFNLPALTDATLIASYFKSTIIKKGAFVLQADKRCDKLCFVQSGLLRLFSIVDGKEVTQWICTKGYFAVDLSSFIFETQSRWAIQALTECEIFYITKQDYNKIQSIVADWKELEKLFLIRCFTLLEERIFTHLSMSAEDRYLHFFANNSDLFNQVPLQYIASMLGMTPETFSRIRKKQLG